MSIRTRIFAGCLALTLLTVLTGAIARQAERRLGQVALDIYDNGFMAVSYLREAQVGFADLAAHPAHATPAVVADLLGDLDVVHDRATSDRARALATTLQQTMRIAVPLLPRNAAIGSAVQAQFGLLVEVVAADGFRYRQQVGRLVEAQLRRTGIVLGVSILAALSITALLGRLISPPILRAVQIAQQIAGGDLDTPVVVSGRGETGDLLRALATMQASIAAAMQRIRSLMDRQAEQHADAIAEQNAKLDAALQNMTQGLCLFDPEGRLAIANRRFTEMFGAPHIGDTAAQVLNHAGLSALLDVGQDASIAALTCDLPDGRSVAVSQHWVGGGGWVATYEDVSERRQSEARLAHMARHDALTGLSNRLGCSEHLRAALARPDAANRLALLCLHLDRFKLINETISHAASAALLCAVAARLQAAIGPADLLTRLGDDAFAVVQDVPGQPREAAALARRLIELMGEPYLVDGESRQVGASIGIALADQEIATPEALLSDADLALQQAREDGRGSLHFFEPEMNLRMQARRALKQDLRRALASDQLAVFYQPLLAASGGISGFEALVRWRHPVRGLVSPAEFIPLAEETGLIVDIGMWVMRRACTDCAGWGHALKVAVNLSPVQFRGGTLVQDVAAVLAESRLPAQRLELEITESVLLQEDEQVMLTLQGLRAQGVRIAMDDFGTGYSSLGYLRRFPFDKIKIDQSFVGNMCRKDDCRAIVRAVIGLGRALGIRVNAEGVETEEQHQVLLEEGCNELQGYLFSKPQPEEAVAGLLRRLGVAEEAEVRPGAMPPALPLSGILLMNP